MVISKMVNDKNYVTLRLMFVIQWEKLMDFAASSRNWPNAAERQNAPVSIVLQQ
jgi:hypothetical protein